MRLRPVLQNRFAFLWWRIHRKTLFFWFVNSGGVGMPPLGSVLKHLLQ